MDRKDDRLIRFRRCHVCGAVTEKNGKIKRCHDCGKSVAPFFYFDDLIAPVRSDFDNKQSQTRAKSLPQGKFLPLIGLTAHWEIHEG